jgi:hypothetical protein
MLLIPLIVAVAAKEPEQQGDCRQMGRKLDDTERQREEETTSHIHAYRWIKTRRRELASALEKRIAGDI